MERFKNILAVYDGTIGSDEALGQAVSLAKANRARLSIINVIPENQCTPGIREDRRRRLESLLPAIDRGALSGLSVQVECGTPFLEITRAVLRAGHDLIIASAEGGSVLRNVFFGSTAIHLMRKAPCPVWIMKPKNTGPFQRILAAVDPCADTAESEALNSKIMDLATSLTMAHNAHLHIAHAWDVEGKDREAIASDLPDLVRTAICEKHHALHKNALDELLEGYPLSRIDHEIHLPQGLPQRCIADLVDRYEVDLIVMGTVNRSGIPGLLMGNAAESLLASVNCGVLTVKPEGFVTPVTVPRPVPVQSSAA